MVARVTHPHAALRIDGYRASQTEAIVPQAVIPPITDDCASFEELQHTIPFRIGGKHVPLIVDRQVGFII